MVDWKFKIYAYLHDPPDKPLVLGRVDHESWGMELADLLCGGNCWDESWRAPIKRADKITSGADRTTLIGPQEIDFSDLRHPLSGQVIDLQEYGFKRTEVSVEKTRQALKEEIGKIIASLLIIREAIEGHRLFRRIKNNPDYIFKSKKIKIPIYKTIKKGAFLDDNVFLLELSGCIRNLIDDLQNIQFFMYDGKFDDSKLAVSSFPLWIIGMNEEKTEKKKKRRKK